MFEYTTLCRFSVYYSLSWTIQFPLLCIVTIFHSTTSIWNTRITAKVKSLHRFVNFNKICGEWCVPPVTFSKCFLVTDKERNSQLSRTKNFIRCIGRIFHWYPISCIFVRLIIIIRVFACIIETTFHIQPRGITTFF